MAVSLHETCQQYVARRLSEGWEIVWQKGYNLILSSPDGNILRPVDLRNDVETLRPNAPGDETSIAQVHGSVTHWGAVDEVVPDEDSSYVHTASKTFQRDLYNLPASSGSGTINKITVWFRCRVTTQDYNFAKASIKSDGTVTDGSQKNPTTSWGNFSQQWATNPADGHAWEWADIDALQIGVSLQGDIDYAESAYCTQVYVEVDYTPAAGRSYGFVIGC